MKGTAEKSGLSAAPIDHLPTELLAQRRKPMTLDRLQKRAHSTMMLLR